LFLFCIFFFTENESNVLATCKFSGVLKSVYFLQPISVMMLCMLYKCWNVEMLRAKTVVSIKHFLYLFLFCIFFSQKTNQIAFMWPVCFLAFCAPVSVMMSCESNKYWNVFVLILYTGFCYICVLFCFVLFCFVFFTENENIQKIQCLDVWRFLACIEWMDQRWHKRVMQRMKHWLFCIVSLYCLFILFFFVFGTRKCIDAVTVL